MKLILNFLFFLGLVLLFFEIKIYRKTVIDYKTPFLLMVLIGFIISFFNKDFLKINFEIQSLFYRFIFNIVTFGGITSYTFMALNYYSPDTYIRENKFQIINKTSISGSKYHRNERKPLVSINYFGKEKELIFSYEETKRINDSDSIILHTKKGNLGYDIIVNLFPK
jgi:hypothetical protein